LFLNAMLLSGQAASFNYMGAVQTGVGSFWDYRASEWEKDNDGWKLEKNHYLALTRKTTQFVETSWKLARSRKIPDEWLIRDIDLEQLSATLGERDLGKRLRILHRMEPRMQCFPPYYYYVARTQQALGELTAAAATYRKLRALQTGHFRRDEMLAAALANLAAIEHSRNQPEALATARDALRESTDVWEALLAHPLRQNGNRITGQQITVIRSTATIIARRRPHRLLRRRVKLPRHQTRRQTAKSRSHLMRSRRKPLAQQHHNPRRHACQLRRKFQIIHAAKATTMGRWLIMPTNAKQIARIQIPQANPHQILLHRLRNQARIAHLLKCGNHNLPLPRPLHRPRQSLFISSL
jgi:hypothetical protein